MNSLRKTMLFAQMGRRLATVETRASLSNSLKLKQERMQVPDGRPVHLKGGTTDTMLMQLTFLLCAIGLGSCFKVYYDLSVPKK